MRTIAALNLLFRAGVELPEDLSIATEEFREGWNLSRLVDIRLLKKKILNCGWNLTKLGDGFVRSGVGDTSQEAISSALKLALHRLSEHFNAVEVEYIELTQYPWFFLARVRISYYRIEQSAVEPVSDYAGSLPIASRQRRLPRQSAAPYLHYDSASPMLKEMLILSRSTQERTH